MALVRAALGLAGGQGYLDRLRVFVPTDAEPVPELQVLGCMTSILTAAACRRSPRP
jgi:hypothetical protein